ncbi:hypothetical protein CIW52_27500 [Mycolicibacterium sp. P9-64]|uniref:NAD(P)H-binding protein n=1 Tax=Mycolicibacterium sp. P9-64 TaxID=2024612 RepID=UPI0011EFD390|nr:NAD(P)H-binding protein [Mycolicibacterium sp. P9-64]KAA0079864.1 hypothetical protein CIW52_27500 [Mycolicibacterium sp. P9-64]
MATFLILGGTGKVGRRLAARATGLGHTAHVASRSAQGTRFDWDDTTTYAPALDGVDAVFVVGPGSASDWTGQLNQFLDRAADAGVKRAVLLSARGVEFLPDGVVGLVERTFTDGPVPGTILRPTHFAQNFTEAMFTPRNGVILAPAGTAPHPFVDVSDIADVAAHVLADGGHDGEAIALSGPEALTFHEVAAVLQATSGVPVRYEPEDRDAHIRRLRDAGTPETYITWRMAMLDGIADGRDSYVSDGTQRALGRSANTFQRWARAEAAR